MTTLLPKAPPRLYDPVKQASTAKQVDFDFADYGLQAIESGIMSTPEMLGWRWYEAAREGDDDKALPIPQEEFTNKYSHLELDWEEGMTYHQAERRASVRERNIISSLMAQQNDSIIGNAAFFAGTIAPQLLSPTNIAMSAIPIFGGGKKFIDFAKQFNGWKQGAMLGGVGGLIGTASFEPITAGAYEAEGDDYTAADFMLNALVVGPLVGGTIGAPLGAMKDIKTKYGKRASFDPGLELGEAIANALDEGKIQHSIPVDENGVPTADYAAKVKNDQTSPFGGEVETQPVAEPEAPVADAFSSDLHMYDIADTPGSTKDIKQHMVGEPVIVDDAINGGHSIKVPSNLFDVTDNVDNLSIFYPMLSEKSVPDFRLDNQPDIKLSAGIVVKQKHQGKTLYVLAEPKGHFAGVTITFPKGKIDPGETAQQAAIREFFEETGLVVKITGFQGVYDGTTGSNIMYTGELVGGDTAKMGSESQAVYLAEEGSAIADSLPDWQKPIFEDTSWQKTPAEQLGKLKNKLSELETSTFVPGVTEADAAAIQKLIKSQKIIHKTEDSANISLDNKYAEPLEKPIPLEDIETVVSPAPQQGSNPASIVVDKTTGKHYYMKHVVTGADGQSNVNHLKNEYITNLFYRAAEIPTLWQRFVIEGDKVVGLASVIREDLTDVSSSLISAPLQTKFNEGALIDMWLANWDVAAPGNIGRDKASPIIRTDVGGGLLYRAKGKLKGTEETTGFEHTVPELESMMELDVYKDPHGLPLSEAELQTGLNTLNKFNETWIDNLVMEGQLPVLLQNNLRVTLKARRNWLINELAKKYGMTTRTTPMLNTILTPGQIQKYIKEQAKKLKGLKLSKAERDALAHHQSGDWATLNQWLRKIGTEPSDHVIEGYQEIKDNANKALHKFSLKYGMTVSRKIDSAHFLDKAYQYAGVDHWSKLKGHTLIDPGFGSTALGDHVWNGDVRMRVFLPEGTPGMFLGEATGSMKSEIEFLLPTDMKYHILDIKNEGGVYKIDAMLDYGSNIPDYVGSVEGYHTEPHDAQWETDASSISDINLAKVLSDTQESINALGPEGVELDAALKKELRDIDELARHKDIGGGCIDG